MRRNIKCEHDLRQWLQSILHKDRVGGKAVDVDSVAQHSASGDEDRNPGPQLG